jgi:hypothetical protein
MRGHVGAGAVWSSASCHPERSEGSVSNRVGAGVVLSRVGTLASPWVELAQPRFLMKP